MGVHTKVSCSSGPETPFRTKFPRSLRVRLGVGGVESEILGADGLKFNVRTLKGYSLRNRVTGQNND